MIRSLVSRIAAHSPSHSKSEISPRAAREDIAEAEQTLGFPIPELLRACYLDVGNGGFGPGWGVIGVRGGYESDYGTLAGTHAQLKGDRELEQRTWPSALLPFCDWGANIFTCVSCLESTHPIVVFEDFELSPQDYELDRFFEMWIEGVDLPSLGTVTEQVEFINPFTRKPSIMYRRRRKTKEETGG